MKLIDQLADLPMAAEMVQMIECLSLKLTNPKVKGPIKILMLQMDKTIRKSSQPYKE
jgi:hypothetical protein